MANESGQAQDQQFDSLDELVQHHMEKHQIPGATVAIMRDGDVDAHGYGVISLNTEYPTRPDTLFQIGSNTKVFTATLATKLVEQGKLNLDTPVREYLPDLKLADEQALATISMRNLLTHTSGLEGDIFEDKYGVGDDALARGIDAAYTWSQETDVGQYWSYCNSGFYLAGRVLEAIAGQTYESAMAEQLFKPLGLERTFWFAHEAIVHSAAAGHSQNPGQEKPEVAAPWPIPRFCNPAGAIVSNVYDLCTFLQFHSGNGVTKSGEQYLSSESVKDMQTPQLRVNTLTEWGIGWALGEINGVRTLQHGGGTNGHITQMLAVPSKNWGIVVLTNSSKGGNLIGPVIDWAMERELDLKKAEPQPIELPQADLERYAGLYPRQRGSINITVVPGGLQAEMKMKHPLTEEEIEMPPVKLLPVGNHEFIAADEGDFTGLRTEFIMNGGDHARFVRFGGRMTARRD
jgi:CubicO group peptidase (beta-lactamase class C family)